MSVADEKDLVPLGTGFDIVKRGYSRTQVEEHLERLDSDLRLLASDRDASAAQANELARQLERARSEIDGLNAQIERLAMPPTTVEGLSERLQHMLRMAQDEAADTKARGEAEAGHIRARAESDGAVLRGRYEKMLSDLDDRRAAMEAEHREVLARAHAEMEELARQSEENRNRLDREAEERRVQADEDFEIAMSSRRAEAMRVLAEQEAASKAEAERRVREATEHAEKVTTDITERDRRSKEEAERRVREATEDAVQRREAAKAESEKLVRDATEKSTTMVDNATRQAEELRGLRDSIAGQLRGAREMLAGSVPSLEPLDDEDPPQGSDGERTESLAGRHERPQAPVR